MRERKSEPRLYRVNGRVAVLIDNLSSKKRVLFIDDLTFDFVYHAEAEEISPTECKKIREGLTK